MLAEDFDTILHNLGMAWLEHPLFHHAPVAIRLKSAEMSQSIWNAPIRTRTPTKLTPNPRLCSRRTGAGDYDLPEPSSAAGYSAD